MSYQSSYGDTENVIKDASAVNEIMARQGSNFLLDLVAEQAGHTANRFKLNAQDRNNLQNSLIDHFNNAIAERL